MHLKAKRNEYADALGEVLDAAPKAVLAAIAVSGFTAGGDQIHLAKNAVLNEWRVLHLNGIVSQPPPKNLLAKYPEPTEEMEKGGTE